MTARRALRTASTLLLAAGMLCQTPLAFAQLPPHRPGTICVTERLWCWANPPGQRGEPCTCRTPYGPVHGRLD